MKLKDILLRDLDLWLTLIILIFLFVSNFYSKIEYSILIGSDTFLQVYTAIVAVVLTVFVVISSFNKKLFVNVIQKGFYGIFRRSFYTPLVASITGIIYTLITPFKLIKMATEMVYIFNLGILIYSILSSLVLFNFIFKLTFELKKELYKNK